MTRLEVLQKYQIVAGRIRTPGLFEYQALYVPYFWEKYLSGNAHEVSDYSVQFSVLESDRIQFPELGARSTVMLRFDNEIVTEA